MNRKLTMALKGNGIVATRVMVDGIIYKAIPKLEGKGSGRAGCSFKFSSESCYKVPSVCSAEERREKTGVIWAKEE